MRDNSIDVLRCIGIIAILAAHVSPSEIVWQFFDYNVCLIVFLSGGAYMLSSAKVKSGGYIDYVIKRLKRILIPTWIFLIVYYGVIISYFLQKGRYDAFSVNGMINTFSLQTGWYVWVMRVFLITALVAPIIKILQNRVGKYGVVIIGVLTLVIYEFLHINNNDSIGYYLTMTIPYIVVFSIGMIIKDFCKRQQIIMTVFFLVVFLCYAINISLDNGSFLCTNNYKCPPLLYFSTFGLGSSILFWILKDHIYNITRKIRLDKLMSFIGSHTMWFYLIHIPLVMLAVHLPVNKFVQFTFVLIATTLLTYLYVNFVKKVVLKRLNSDISKKNVKLIFLG